MTHPSSQDSSTRDLERRDPERPDLDPSDLGHPETPEPSAFGDADLVPADLPHPDLVRPVVLARPTGWHARLDLPLLPRSCPSARRTAQHLLRAWQVPDGDRAHAALLVLSELVGNALRHGGERVVLELDLDGTVLTVGVRDDAAGLPRQRAAGSDAECGRGLDIVAALTDAWGVDELDEGGKRVWARLDLQA